MKMSMDWNPALYGPEAAEILALAGDGRQLLPLVLPRNTDGPMAARLNRPARELFPKASNPELAHAGLWLYFGFFDTAHSIAQDVKTADGSYWHAMLHRMEPDAGNAGYWFRRVGDHPLFPELQREALALGYPTGPRWDPFAFVAACDRAAPSNSHLLQQVQLAEWQLLFHFCAKVK